MRLLILLVSVSASVACGQSAPTFMQFGNVVHGYGSGQVALMNIGLQTATPLQVVPTGMSCNAFIWDPANADDLIAWASNGHIYRATVTGAGVSLAQITVSPIQGTAGIQQMSWDAGGDLITVGSGLSSDILRVDPVSGLVTTVLSWPFNSSLRCGRVDPATGDYYVGNNQGLWRVSGVLSGTPSVVNVVSGAVVDDVAFDPGRPQDVLYLTSGDVKRVNKITLTIETVVTSPPNYDHIRADEQGTFVAVDGRNVYRFSNPQAIPTGGVAAMLIGSNTSIGCCSNTDVTVVGDGITPFRLEVGAVPGGGAQISIDGIPVGISESWMFVSRTTVLPAGAGPFLGILPDAWTFQVMAATAVPQPGGLLHSAGAPTSSAVFPAGSLTPFVGETWDAVLAALGPNGEFWGRTNVARVTWQ